ncbi:MAG: 6-phospho-beta-glucosidase [Myxococcota bacterium]
MKVTIVGGGSTYSPELVNGLAGRAGALGLSEVVLQDPREDRLGPVGAFCARMVSAMGAPVTVRTTTSLDEALDGADFVVVQIRVGGQQGRHEDIRLGLDRGLIGQETTGVGGFAKALRTIPVVLDIAEQIRERCPDAWLLNFTNPSGMVTEALLRAGHTRTVGLCNVPIEMHMDIAKVLDRPVEDVTLDWVGLNHLGWVRRVLVDGRDVLPGLLEDIEAQVPGPANLPELGYPDGFLRALGALPSSYVRFFYAPDAMLESIQSNTLTRAEEVMVLEEELLTIYADPESTALPAALSKRGGAWYSRLAVEVIQALQGDEPTVHIVNALNGGSLPGVPVDASVEVPCKLSRHGVEPVDSGAVDPALLGLIQAVKAYEQLGIEAALTGDPDAAFKALVAHPLVPDAHVAADVLKALTVRGLIAPPVSQETH